MHETIVRVLELSSIIEKEKWSSENYLTVTKQLATYRLSLIVVENWKFKIKLEQLCVFTENVTFKPLISLVIWIKFWSCFLFLEEPLFFHLLQFSAVIFFSDGQNQDKYVTVSLKIVVKPHMASSLPLNGEISVYGVKVK